MDSANLKNMHRILNGDPAEKFYLLRDFTKTPGDIADPWYTGDFETTYQQVVQGCKDFLSQLN